MHRFCAKTKEESERTYDASMIQKQGREFGTTTTSNESYPPPRRGELLSEGKKNSKHLHDNVSPYYSRRHKTSKQKSVCTTSRPPRFCQGKQQRHGQRKRTLDDAAKQRKIKSGKSPNKAQDDNQQHDRDIMSETISNS